MAGLIQKLKDQLECAICTEYNEKETKTLTCLHSFCKECIITAAKGEKSISCPVCRRVTEFPGGKVDGLLNDYAKAQIHDMIKGYDEEPLSVVQQKPAEPRVIEMKQPVLQNQIPPVESKEEAMTIERAMAISLENQQPQKRPKMVFSPFHTIEMNLERSMSQDEIEEERLEQAYVEKLGKRIKIFRKDSNSIKLTLNTSVADMPRSIIAALAMFLDQYERWYKIITPLGFT